MSKQNFEKTLKKELEVLNDVIDQKIIKGLPYTKESRRHRFIMKRLNDIHAKGGSRFSWLTKSLRFASFF